MSALSHDTTRGTGHGQACQGLDATPIDAQARREFGARLKAHRELRSIPLSVIAETTKVNKSFLEGLERGDLSRWPKGIFQRAFFRDYVIAIGLPLEDSTSEFLALFSEEATPRVAPVATPSASPAPLRLTLDAGPQPFATDHLLAAALDLALLTAASTVVAWFERLDVWTVAGVIALCYYVISTACLGRSVSATWISGRRRSRLSSASEQAALPGLPAWMLPILPLSSAQNSPSPSSPPAQDLHSTT